MAEDVRQGGGSRFVDPSHGTADEEDGSAEECPLCTEALDLTDRHIRFCACGYRICLWCWHQIMENAAKEDAPGRCPACRSIYEEEAIEESLKESRLSPEELLEQAKKKKVTQRNEKKGQQKDRKHLQNVRVIQRNLVYVIGLSMKDCREEVIRKTDMFGRFGRVTKVSVNRTGTNGNGGNFAGPTGSAYITYGKNEDALRCIQACDGALLDGKVIRCCFGTTKYCNAFLRNQQCTNPDCLYLHEMEPESDGVLKDEQPLKGDAKTHTPGTSLSGSRILPPTAAHGPGMGDGKAPSILSGVSPPMYASNPSVHPGMGQARAPVTQASSSVTDFWPSSEISTIQAIPPGMVQRPSAVGADGAGAISGMVPSSSPPGLSSRTSVSSFPQPVLGSSSSVEAIHTSSQTEQATWLDRVGSFPNNQPVTSSKRTMTMLGAPGLVVPREQPSLASEPLSVSNRSLNQEQAVDMGAGSYPIAHTSTDLRTGHERPEDVPFGSSHGQMFSLHTGRVSASTHVARVGEGHSTDSVIVGSNGRNFGTEANLAKGTTNRDGLDSRAYHGYIASQGNGGKYSQESGLPFMSGSGTSMGSDELKVIQDIFTRPIPITESRRSTSRFSFADNSQTDSETATVSQFSMDGDSFFRSLLPGANIRIIPQSSSTVNSVSDVGQRVPPPGFAHLEDTVRSNPSLAREYGRSDSSSGGYPNEDLDSLTTGIQHVNF